MPMKRITGMVALLPLCLLAAACGGSDSKPAQSPTAAAGLPIAADVARLPGPRLFEALAQSAQGTVLVQADLSGLVYVQYQDNQAVSHGKSCHAEATAPFKEVLALSKSVSPVNTKLAPASAASLLAMYQLKESGGLERLVFSGTGDGPVGDPEQAAVGRLLATIANGCRP